MSSDDDLTVVYLWARKEAEDEIKALRAENERLREVLLSIACTDADCSCVNMFDGPTEYCVYGKARAALGEKK